MKGNVNGTGNVNEFSDKGYESSQKRKGITHPSFWRLLVYVQSDEIAHTRTCVFRYSYVSVDVNIYL
jgi:hypothetical protein